MRPSIHPLCVGGGEQVVTSENALAWIRRYAEYLAENKEYLTKLDSEIGDADHGANMHRGFQAVINKDAELQGKDIGSLFKTVAMTLISTVGGAGGPLYGTFFLQASTSAAAKSELTAEEFVSTLEKGLAGVISRGKAQVGDKTMIDAMQPAIKRLRQSLSEGATLSQALAKAAQDAEAGAKSTIPLIARKGRASYLGERSAGHQDPGATSTLLLFRAASETIS
jgi:phosphoenolpyruvate---glycerone phosphotransferase subunit DhaL